TAADRCARPRHDHLRYTRCLSTACLWTHYHEHYVLYVAHSPLSHGHLQCPCSSDGDMPLFPAAVYPLPKTRDDADQGHADPPRLPMAPAHTCDNSVGAVLDCARGVARERGGAT